VTRGNKAGWVNAAFLTAHDEDTLQFGSPSPCAHCGDVARAREMTTPSGRPYLAHYPSDTCCQDRARDVYGYNRTYAIRYRAQGGKTNIEEAESLDERNREIARVMRTKGFAP